MKKEKHKTEKENYQADEAQSEQKTNHEKINEVTSDEDNLNEESIDVVKEETGEEILKEEIKILKEEKIRVLAEMENLRKRFEREKIDSIKYGSVNFARDILSPGDNLERALSAINEEDEHPQSIKNLIEGLLMVKKELSTALEKNGITKIDSLDKKFDPIFTKQ